MDDFTRHLEAIGRCTEVVPLRQATMAALALFGIACAYYIAPLTRDPRVGRVVTNWGLPWEWEMPYRERLHRSDPLPNLAVERLSPVVWPDTVDFSRLTRKQATYMEFAATFGLGRGVGVACFGPDGRSGYLGAILPEDAPPPSAGDLQRLQAVGQVSFQTYCRIVKLNEATPSLSNRELEVLHWMGRGKSNSVIAELLGISPSSVDVYVRRIFAKFDVTDRTSATLRAYAQGLLVSADYEQFVDRNRREEEAGKGDTGG